jgi:hypothetical protein
LDGGSDAAGTCNPQTCTGCCANNVCQGGTTSATCGKGGVICATCSGPQVCKTDQTCGVDPEGTWKVQPVSATISATNQGADWDALGGLPDPFVDLWCPSTAATFTSRTPTAPDTLSPTWSAGGCVMKAKDLMTTGFALDVWDEDVSSNDPIAAKGTIVPKESDLLVGFGTVGNGVTLTTLKIAYQKQ